MARKYIVNGRIYEATGSRKVIVNGRIVEETTATAQPLSNKRISSMHFARPWEPTAMGS